MRDPVAYRIRYAPHPHVGDKWCIYPTYDYTHCINDSLEHITHSLCTLEFEIRRESYYWLLEALDLYKPYVWEYSRLNLTYTVLSKRKLERLVNEKVVDGWDDPRILTILGLRRRGYTATMINEFAHEIGVSRKGNENVTSIKLLEFFARRELDREAPRTFGVLDPVLLNIVNYDEVVKNKEV
jgi:glutaminyl-tRNA synthetase